MGRKSAENQRRYRLSKSPDAEWRRKEVIRVGEYYKPTATLSAKENAKEQAASRAKHLPATSQRWAEVVDHISTRTTPRRKTALGRLQGRWKIKKQLKDMFKCLLEKVPHRNTVEIMARELGVVSDLMVAEMMMEEEHLTIGFDATTQEGFMQILYM